MKPWPILLLLALLLLPSACTSRMALEQDPFFDSFFDMTRHIMSSEEIDIYRHLPDKESKQDFITEFWAKRDPDPNTEENESKESFEERIDFANRWFDERKGKKRGWDTLRGRILLQLGFPEERRTGQNRTVDRYQTSRFVPTEVWVYYRHQLVLTFVDRKGFGEYDLENIPASLLTAIDNSKYAIDSAVFPDVKNAFKFEAVHRDGMLEITIPTKRLIFTEEGENLTARLNFVIYLYQNFRKQDTLVRETTYSNKKDSLLTMNEVTVKLPLDQLNEGSYFLDIIGRDLGANQRFRTFCQIKKR
jgi:GWxTD domain-containing protein